MDTTSPDRVTSLSVIIPCFNEAKTLQRCVERVLGIADKDLLLEIIIVDDASSDESLSIAKRLEKMVPEIKVFHHAVNQGKGAALRTGFQAATGEFVAVHDADLEYDPMDLKRLLVPLVNNDADVVLGSRFLSPGAHRVLYFWHSLGNSFLTLVSNMFTDLNLTDMETCYKVFRRDIIQNIQIEEDRFGFEPEIIAKVAHMRVRIFEMGISYYGRTYEEGKKIGAKDGLRALYCIFRYNAHQAPLPMQFVLYLFIGGIAAGVNLFTFLGLFHAGLGMTISAPIAFVIAAILNYLLCIHILFRHTSKWNSSTERMIYILLVILVGALDLGITTFLYNAGTSPALSKIVAILLGFVLNFPARRFFVFPESPTGPWRSQVDSRE